MLLWAIDTTGKELSVRDIQTISGAIYRLEGGSKTLYPYGIRSINTGGNKEKAKQICIKTITNNYSRWQKTDKKLSYLDFLANRYCPPTADKQGNFACLVEMNGDNFKLGNIQVKYNQKKDIHSFFKID